MHDMPVLMAPDQHAHIISTDASAFAIGVFSRKIKMGWS
jgi:hypothetical protein